LTDQTAQPDDTVVAERFSQRVIAWQRKFGRHDLPWQERRDAYRIWVSEIMLQQTQVATVIPYYQRFIGEFPAVELLAAAPLDRIMQLWSGLGYYSRARNLHRCAQALMQRFDGKFPQDTMALESLPGIGRSTAAAIASLAFGVPAAILDGNVKRVMARHFGIAGYPGEMAVQKRLWQVAERAVPTQEIEPYTQGLMDLGASVCLRSKPQCSKCPVNQSCVALRTAQVSLIPSAKPRAPLPERFVLLLMISRGDEILVLKRPPSGIWGGLWSLPELPLSAAEYEEHQCSAATRSQVLGWLADQGLVSDSMTTLATFDHRFTHFRLNILPLMVSLSSRAASVSSPAKWHVAEPAMLWLKLQDVTDAALPKPVKSLLQALPERAG
jgi:A/G-specific adenine glycosylase